jgi:1-acyl-sn-glycerol-3-phosphate acyltransferase
MTPRPTARRLPAAWEHVCLWSGLGMLGLLCLVWLPFALVLGLVLPARIGKPFGRRTIMHAFRFYLAWLSLLGGFRFDIRALDALRDSGPMLLAPNHPCLLDAVMILSRLPDVACVMKASLMNNPLLGAAARLAGYIRNEPSVSMVLGALDDLRHGSQLLLFPEGTRTVRPPVNDCYTSCALIARRARVPVQAIIIETDSAFLAKGWPLFRRPAMPIHYRIRLGQRFEPPHDITACTARLQAHLAEELDRAELVPPPAPAASA